MTEVKPEDVVWRGRTYRRWPGHANRSQRVYFMATSAPRNYLHRDVYEFHYGPIPAGWHIHHVDHDALNNAPDNLEAITPTAHAEHHAEHIPELAARCAGCDAEFIGHRPWAKWCSPACKERTRRAEGTAYQRPRTGPWAEQRVCADCDSTYIAKRPWSRFCSSACKQRTARKAVA